MSKGNMDSIARRVYRYNGVTLVLLAGNHYGKKDSAISTKHPAKVKRGEHGTVTVMQKIAKKAAVTEVWRKVTL